MTEKPLHHEPNFMKLIGLTLVSAWEWDNLLSLIGVTQTLEIVAGVLIVFTCTHATDRFVQFRAGYKTQPRHFLIGGLIAPIWRPYDYIRQMLR